MAGSGTSNKRTDHRLAAILSADVVGYSRLMAADEDGTVAALGEARRTVERLVPEHRGRLVDFTGDNFLAEFPSALDGTRCAVALQEGFAELGKLRFRIGLHLGDVRVEGERIYGDGVNIAARLEGMAEPGGICLSGSVHEQVRRKLELDFEDLGEREVKNIPDRVRALRIRPASGPGAPASDLSALSDSSEPGAIAVLPFEVLGGDAEQQGLADGIAEDLITRLSQYHHLPVLARNATFAYRGKVVEPAVLREALGARYFVEGSLRRAGDRMRVTAQLIDAESGHHVWAQRYDREPSDLFVLQDEMADAIGATVMRELDRYEQDRAVRRDPEALDVWELQRLGYWHVLQVSREDNRRALELFQLAVQRAPHQARGHSGVALARLWEVLCCWAEDVDASLRELRRAAEAALSRDVREPAGHQVMAAAWALEGELDRALMAAERCLELTWHPNGHVRMAHVLVLMGRNEEARAQIEEGMARRDEDQFPFFAQTHLALVHFAAGRYEQAVDAARAAIAERRGFLPAHQFLSASYHQQGREADARRVLDGLLAEDPRAVSTEGLRRYMGAGPSELTERLFGALREVGWPERPPPREA